jgi:protoporphyrinogen/coproporphyrinogen III oxidase
MSTPDVIVVGGGVSGLAFAFRAAQAGQEVLLLEASPQLGGCVRSHRLPDGFWFELGAHTVYNSYGGFLDLAVGTGAVKELVKRGPARTTFGLLRGGEVTWLTPPRVLLKLDWLEAAVSFPRGFLRGKAGETVYSYYSGLVGRRNYDRIFSPFFAAVPSQKADGFPAQGPGSLFKKRPRRQEFPRSFGFRGGLQAVCDAVGRTRGIVVQAGVAAERVERDGGGFGVVAADGQSYAAPVVALATPPQRAAAMLDHSFHELADAVSKVAVAEADSVGVVLPRELCWMPECAFVVPVDDLFHSAVTRDPFPDPTRRAFTFHFKPGLAREQRLRRMAEVLRVPVAELPAPAGEAHWTLPAPAVNHAQTVAEIDRVLAGGRLALCGNYFEGLAIEDCVQRGGREWVRVSG